jgi:hypothetical protein
VEDWAEIRRLCRSEGMPIKVVARVMGCSKNTVKRALAADGPPIYQRPPRGSIVDAVEPRVRELLQAWPTMPTTVIAERIGWDRSIRVLRDRVAELRPVYLPPDPASRIAYAAGGRPVRSVVPRYPAAGRVRPVRPDPAASVGDGDRVCPVAVGPAASLRAVEDLLCGWWALLRRWGGASGAGLGQRGGDRAVAAWPQQLTRPPGVPRHPGHQGGDLPSG